VSVAGRYAESGATEEKSQHFLTLFTSIANVYAVVSNIRIMLEII
jgi:hypothetical protein